MPQGSKKGGEKMGLIQKIANSKIVKTAVVMACLSAPLAPAIYDVPALYAQESYNSRVEETIEAYANRKSHEEYKNMLKMGPEQDEAGLKIRDDILEKIGKGDWMDAEPKQQCEDRSKQQYEIDNDRQERNKKILDKIEKGNWMSPIYSK